MDGEKWIYFLAQWSRCPDKIHVLTPIESLSQLKVRSRESFLFSNSFASLQWIIHLVGRTDEVSIFNKKRRRRRKFALKTFEAESRELQSFIMFSTIDTSYRRFNLFRPAFVWAGPAGLADLIKSPKCVI